MESKVARIVAIGLVVMVAASMFSLGAIGQKGFQEDRWVKHVETKCHPYVVAEHNFATYTYTCAK